MGKTFATNIKELRTSSNLTQTEFAEKINVTQAALSAYEKGTRQPTYETLITISKEFNVSIDWLCALSSKMHNEYQTYSDVFNELVKICTIKYPRDANMSHSHVLHIEFDKETVDGVVFCTSDTNIHHFFKAWISMYKNYSDGLIDEDIYNIWLERELAKYDFSINGLPSWLVI